MIARKIIFLKQQLQIAVVECEGLLHCGHS